MAWRALKKMRRNMEQFFDVTIQPLLFTAMFAYLFGGAISGNVHSYRPQPVPGAVADDRVRTARVPGPRYQHLQALVAVARRVFSPHELDQLFGADRTAFAGRESSKQRLRAIARNRSPPPAHIGKQGQGDAHLTSLEARPIAQRIRRCENTRAGCTCVQASAGAADAELADRTRLLGGNAPSYPAAGGLGIGGPRGEEAR
jgi:hypothetical protein